MQAGESKLLQLLDKDAITHVRDFLRPTDASSFLSSCKYLNQEDFRAGAKYALVLESKTVRGLLNTPSADIGFIAGVVSVKIPSDVTDNQIDSLVSMGVFDQIEELDLADCSNLTHKTLERLQITQDLHGTVHHPLKSLRSIKLKSESITAGQWVQFLQNRKDITALECNRDFLPLELIGLCETGLRKLCIYSPPLIPLAIDNNSHQIPAGLSKLEHIEIRKAKPGHCGPILLNILSFSRLKHLEYPSRVLPASLRQDYCLQLRELKHVKMVPYFVSTFNWRNLLSGSTIESLTTGQIFLNGYSDEMQGQLSKNIRSLELINPFPPTLRFAYALQGLSTLKVHTTHSQAHKLLLPEQKSKITHLTLRGLESWVKVDLLKFITPHLKALNVTKLDLNQLGENKDATNLSYLAVSGAVAAPTNFTGPGFANLKDLTLEAAGWSESNFVELAQLQGLEHLTLLARSVDSLSPNERHMLSSMSRIQSITLAGRAFRPEELGRSNGTA